MFVKLRNNRFIFTKYLYFEKSFNIMMMVRIRNAACLYLKSRRLIIILLIFIIIEIMHLHLFFFSSWDIFFSKTLSVGDIYTSSKFNWIKAKTHWINLFNIDLSYFIILQILLCINYCFLFVRLTDFYVYELKNMLLHLIFFLVEMF